MIDAIAWTLVGVLFGVVLALLKNMKDELEDLQEVVSDRMDLIKRQMVQQGKHTDRMVDHSKRLYALEDWKQREEG